MLRVNFCYYQTVIAYTISHTVWKLISLCLTIFPKENIEKFREINILMEMHSKMVLQIALCGIFAQICAKMTIAKVED